MKQRTLFVTGTDTGVGKTTLSCLLTRFLRESRMSVIALKPVCSGGRDDAKVLRIASGDALALDEINPWHFRAALSPLVAARREKRRLKLAQVLDHVRRWQKEFRIVIVEGAGGLLSPMGEDFDSRDLIVALDATPLVVCPNRLGAINQVRLVLESLPRRFARRAEVILNSQPRPDAASRSNPVLLKKFLGAKRVHVLPRITASAKRYPTRELSALRRGLVASVPRRATTDVCLACIAGGAGS